MTGSETITATPADVGSFVVSGFPATTAGVAKTFTVSAFDVLGNAMPNYTGTVNFSSSDFQAGLPASYTFTAADKGVHTFTATLKTAGSQSIRVSDTALRRDRHAERHHAWRPPPSRRSRRPARST